ncbi:hypothetical protein [Mucilaginibacter sp. KACC 22063]|uniref:hypothetical protein n=1 Tax=Mucilaginibacter sp. KACC 22063 TaxID=3025666 RepID=UPI002366B3FC|nr:hypothetical protein [Mucilaginibacter sp. KACC 22063]WDF53549.1 hypothetical protein PQ461_11390 [Mucilaginibacter sp. KACC 22063]
MKKLLMLAISALLIQNSFAQKTINADSLAYENQRKKINDMLVQRAVKFDDYQSSLSKHTGIFGMQTKKDIKNSNTILMDIVNTDNAMLDQIKLLLKFRTSQLQSQAAKLESQKFEQQANQYQARQTQDNTLAYMNTINHLRDANEKLSKQLKQQQHSVDKAHLWLGVVIVLMVSSILLILMSKRRIKA